MIFSSPDTNNIVIGSADCDIDIYLIKIYETTLTDEEHLQNFIVDAPNAIEIINRYDRNNILILDLFNMCLHNLLIKHSNHYII